jgi:hypothetical protein
MIELFEHFGFSLEAGPPFSVACVCQPLQGDLAWNRPAHIRYKDYEGLSPRSNISYESPAAIVNFRHLVIVSPPKHKKAKPEGMAFLVRSCARARHALNR